MEINTNMSNQGTRSTFVIFAHKNTPPPLNPKNSQASMNRDGRNTWSMKSEQLKHHLKPYEPISMETITTISKENDDAKHANLVKHVQRLIAEINDGSFEDLIMVDALQRLAIDFHFEDEINLILRKRYMQFSNTNLFMNHNLYEVSLCFRILRQNGLYVSADTFKKFKGTNEKFDEQLSNDLRGLMALYEASQLSIEGETILDEAEKFTSQILHDTIKFLDDDQAEMVRNTLENPYQKTLPVFNLKNSIKYFNGTVLQELAELEFKKVQTIHQLELDQISRWWTELGLGQELSRARDQPLKWHLWSMVALTNPTHSMQRIDLTKTVSLIYIIDDIFDIYGTIDELTMFTQAINRWDIKAIEQLPYYMKSTFKAVYDITNEISKKVYEEHGFNPISSLAKSWATLCNAFLVEAEWFACGHIPNGEEYLKNGMVTSGIQLTFVYIFLVLGSATNIEEFANIIDDNHHIISSVAKILRLWDDLGNAKDENQDGHDGSYIMCFVNEHEDCSTKIAREHVVNMISDTQKCLNKECLSPSPFSTTFRKATKNVVNMVPLMYNYEDNTSLPQLNDYANAMLFESF